MQMLSKWMKLYREVNKTWRKWERGPSLSCDMFGHNFETQWVWHGSNTETCQAGLWLTCWQKWESVELIFKWRWGCAEACCCYDEISRCVCLDSVFEEALLVTGFLDKIRTHNKKPKLKGCTVGSGQFSFLNILVSQDAQQTAVALINHIASCKCRNQRVLFCLSPPEWV